MKIMCLLVALLLTLSGCGNRQITPAVPQSVYIPPTLELDTTFSSLMDGLLSDGGANSCVSPLSIKMALAMAYGGAEGNTAALLKELFGGMSPSEMHDWAAGYLKGAEQHDGQSRSSYNNAELRAANSFWLRKGNERDISVDFTDVLSASYNAHSGTFSKNPDPINQWVENATNGKITAIIAEIPDEALTYLVNTLYFKSSWVNEFNESATERGDFRNGDGSVVTTDMMRGGADGYIDTDSYEGITKNLNGGFTFTALMPNTDDFVTLDSLLEAQSAADHSYSSIALTLPKFSFDTTVRFTEGSHPEFDALFAHHGMDGALSDDAKTDDLLISQIAHKTTFTLAEKGVEASAATVVLMLVGAAPSSKTAEIVFDRPFHFLLTDSDGETLFVGRVMELPTAP